MTNYNIVAIRDSYKGLQIIPGVEGAGRAGGVRRNLSVISVRGLVRPGSQMACAAGVCRALVHLC